MSLVPPGRAARPEAASSLAPRLTSLVAPCVLASERPSRPGDEASSCWNLLELHGLGVVLLKPADEIGDVGELLLEVALVLLEQLVAVPRVVAKDEEHGRLGESLQPGPYAPAARADAAPAPRAARKPRAPPHDLFLSNLQCKTQIRAD